MGEIKIIDYYPIIMTKDSRFVARMAKTWKMKSGAIEVLPPDAVLIKPPTPINHSKENK